MMSSVNIDVFLWILHIVRLILYPSHYLLDSLFCLYTPTVQDAKNGGIPIFKKLIFTPVTVVLLIITLPIVIVFFPIRCFLLIIRDPFTISVKFTPYTLKNDRMNNNDNTGESRNRFAIASCNICLLPEFLSRFNHLKDVNSRSRQIGERIVVDQFYRQDFSAKYNHLNLSLDSNKNFDKEKHMNFNNTLSESVQSEKISTKFYNIDFLLIQEAWTTYYNKAFIQELHKVYPYIIHDAGVHSFSSNKFALNSGLMIASRYPVVAVDFKPFSNYCKHGGLLSQGLLMVQVNIESGNRHGRRIGYLFNTHMQSYQEDEIVIPNQMDEILQNVDDFMSRTKCQQDEVLFNFLCGDFNCDNMSPGDKECQHHRLFDVYQDFGRAGPGVDKPWTVGTELRQRFMFEPQVTTPRAMKKVLLDPSFRRRHVIDADVQEHSIASLVDSDPPCDEFGNVIDSHCGGKRRIDLVTFHSQHPVKVESYSFVTRLATLTDHIPVQMEFTCLGQNQD